MLAAAVVCSLVVARIGGLRVAGTAIAPPGLSAPAVGDCLMTLADPLATERALRQPPGSDLGELSETAVTFADCAGRHLGEVVAYRRMQSQLDPAAAPSAGPTTGPTAAPAAGLAAGATGQAAPGSSAYPGTPDGQWCAQVAADYRAHEVARFRAGAGGDWTPSTGQRFLTVLSRPNADPAEPRWSACVMLAPLLETYSGSYLQSLAGGPAPSPFGRCLSDDAADRWVSCDAPHLAQEFGSGTGPAMTARDAVDSCRALTEQMTGMDDVSAGGILRVVVIGGGSGTVGAGGQPAIGASCRLEVVGSSHLVGTLLGVANGPLPLA